MLLEESDIVTLFLGSYVDHILGTAHIAQQWLKLRSGLVLTLEVKRSESRSSEELMVEMLRQKPQERFILKDLRRTC